MDNLFSWVQFLNKIDHFFDGIFFPLSGDCRNTS